MLTKVPLVKAMVFLVVMYGCEGWTTEKAEHQRIDAFELWCWRRLLRVPWTTRRSNKSILKEISPEYSLEGMTLKLKLQYFGHLMWKTDSLEKTLMLEKIEDGRRGRRMMRWLDGITSWKIDGEAMETVTDFIYWRSKITAYGDFSHETKRCLLLGWKVMTNLDSILKSRDITLPTKVCLVKAMVFPGVMYGYENGTIKKAEHQEIDAFELWCWSRLFRVPWTARSNQSILKEINPKYSLEGLMLKQKLQYFGHLMWKTDSLEKTLMLGKIEGRRRDR